MEFAVDAAVLLAIVVLLIWGIRNRPDPQAIRNTPERRYDHVRRERSERRY
jgi:hypothetical protein